MGFINTTSKIGLGAAILGLGILSACGDKESGVASSYSETNTGTPIAQLDTAGIAKEVHERGKCGDFGEDGLNTSSNGLTMSSLAMFEDSSTTVQKTVSGREYVDIAFIDCGVNGYTTFHMPVRGQVVDKNGLPVANATVQSSMCSLLGESCEYKTDQSGFFYDKNIIFMTYEQVDVLYADNGEWGSDYIANYRYFYVGAESADKSLGGNIQGSFEDCEVIEIEGTKYVNLGKIVLSEAKPVSE